MRTAIAFAIVLIMIRPALAVELPPPPSDGFSLEDSDPAEEALAEDTPAAAETPAIMGEAPDAPLTVPPPEQNATLPADDPG